MLSKRNRKKKEKSPQTSNKVSLLTLTWQQCHPSWPVATGSHRTRPAIQHIHCCSHWAHNSRQKNSNLIFYTPNPQMSLSCSKVRRFEPSANGDEHDKAFQCCPLTLELQTYVRSVHCPSPTNMHIFSYKQEQKKNKSKMRVCEKHSTMLSL